jgi:hypothetical protein
MQSSPIVSSSELYQKLVDLPPEFVVNEIFTNLPFSHFAVLSQKEEFRQACCDSRHILSEHLVSMIKNGNIYKNLYQTFVNQFNQDIEELKPRKEGLVALANDVAHDITLVLTDDYERPINHKVSIIVKQYELNALPRVIIFIEAYLMYVKIDEDLSFEETKNQILCKLKPIFEEYDDFEERIACVQKWMSLALQGITVPFSDVFIQTNQIEGYLEFECDSYVPSLTMITPFYSQINIRDYFENSSAKEELNEFLSHIKKILFDNNVYLGKGCTFVETKNEEIRINFDCISSFYASNEIILLDEPKTPEEEERNKKIISDGLDIIIDNYIRNCC